MTVDPRISARRRIVQEQGARRRLRWALVLVLLAVVAGIAVWFVYSPALAITRVELHGVVNSAPEALLAEAGVVAGEPMLFVRSGKVETALLRDPWIEDARVELHFPHVVEVTVLERQPLAWVAAGSSWALVSGAGIVLSVAADVPEGEPLIALGGEMGEAPGEVIRDPVVLGALTFLDTLSPSFRHDAWVRSEGPAIWAVVGGFDFKLGGPVEMARKARVAESLLDSDLTDVRSIDLTAPARPAVVPTPEVRAEGSVEGEGNPE